MAEYATPYFFTHLLLDKNQSSCECDVHHNAEISSLASSLQVSKEKKNSYFRCRLALAS